MKQTSGSNSSTSRPRRSQDGDIDLTRALRERDGQLPRSTPRQQPSGRRPVRPGSRVRMDVAKSTRSGPRDMPIPDAPRRRRNRKPINWRLAGPIAVIGFLLIFGSAFALTTHRLAVRNVVFEGVPSDTAATLQAALPHQPIGHNVLAYILLHGHAVQKQMASAQPDIATAHVRAVLPHTLVVQIVRREPFAFLAVGPGGSAGKWILDERGFPIDYASAAHSPSLPKIIVPAPTDGSSVVLGKQLPASMADQAAQAYSLLDALKTQPGLGTLAAISVDKSDNLGLNMSNNLRFKLGQSTQLADKLALLAGLVAQSPTMVAGAKYVDVSYPARPSIMPQSAVDTAASTAQSNAAK